MSAKIITGATYTGSGIKKGGKDGSSTRQFFETLADVMLYGKDYETLKSFSDGKVTVEVSIPSCYNPDRDVITLKTSRKTGKVLCREYISTITLPDPNNANKTHTYIKRYLAEGKEKNSIFHNVPFYRLGFSRNMKIDNVDKPGYSFVTEKAYFSPFKKTEPRKIFARNGVLIGYDYRVGRTHIEFRFEAKSVNA